MSKAFDKFFEDNLHDFQIERINIDNPKFKESGRIHDWRNHVPVSEIWNDLSDEEKKVFAFIAAVEADKEQWD